MASNQPFVLPDGYLDAWTNSQHKMGQPESRVTASGFTSTVIPNNKNTNIRDEVLRTEDQIYETVDNMKRARKSHEDHRKSGRRPKYTDQHFDQLREVEDGLIKSADTLLNGNNRKSKQAVSPTGIYSIPNTQLPDSPFSDKYRAMSDFEQFAANLSIHPDESASQFNPLRLTRKPAQLEAVAEVSSEIPTMSVIGGFRQDVDQKIRELEAYRSVEPIAGLPIIFTNPRLNFLTHVHSALFKIISADNGDYPATNCSELLLADRKNWSRDPSTRLLETVLDATIDSRDGEVLANPFNIPVLEPTMKLTQKLVFMAFDQLHNEFETEWFNTMKSVTTPRFHSKYESHKFKRRSSSDNSSQSARRVSSSSSNSHKQSEKKSSNRSVVSTLFSFD
jgi:hypothetical protein